MNLKTIAIFVGAAIVAIIFGVITAISIKDNPGKIKSIPQPNQVVNATPTTAFPTQNAENWQIYKNNTYNFQIKYPSDWKVTESRKSIYPSAIYEVFLYGSKDVQISQFGVITPSIRLTIFKKSNNLELFDWIKTNIDKAAKNVGKRLIDGKEALEISRFSYEYPANYDLVTENKGYVYYVSMFNSKKVLQDKIEGYNMDNNQQLFNTEQSILSSLKFSVESNSQLTCPTSEWVDCMPGPDVGSRPECEPAYLKWAKENCAGFQGAAL